MFCFRPQTDTLSVPAAFLDTFSALRAQNHSIHYSLPPLLLQLALTKLTGKGILLFKTQSSTSRQAPVFGFCISLAARVDRCPHSSRCHEFVQRGKTEADYGLET